MLCSYISGDVNTASCVMIHLCLHKCDLYSQLQKASTSLHIVTGLQIWLDWQEHAGSGIMWFKQRHRATDMLVRQWHSMAAARIQTPFEGSK